MRWYLQMHIIDEATNSRSHSQVSMIIIQLSYVTDYGTAVTLSKMSIVADIAR